MSLSEWLSIAGLAVNLLLLPLLKILIEIKSKVDHASAILPTHEKRLDNLESRIDRRQGSDRRG